ncbi:MAG TPA: tetratricopeptide repeat protein [Gemmatimonadota bacterium]|nr:tetratricopeptide repeat protein [Gemmatimonadota bacterium]
MKTTGRPLLVAILLFAGLTPFACSKNQEASRGDQESTGLHAVDDAATHSTASEGEPPPLYDGLGDHHREITTRSEQAQAYFDQGLRLQYAFNHAEAIRSYEAALGADPECAMCWWGIALAAGNNINAGIDEAGGRLAHEAAGKAEALAEGATEPERMLIEAISARYGPEPLEDRISLDSAYARAMERVAESYPRDTDVVTLYAASLMNLSPWHYWEGPYDDRMPRPGTLRIVSTLEDALEIDANHPGACHYLIHAVEAAYPERAVECADRLASLMPAAGHIVHMPGHIYIRVGRYRDAVEANRHAVHQDESYIADQGQQSVYTGAYYPHNYHFMAFAATMAGMKEDAMYAARTVSPKVPLEVARAVPFIQNAIVMPDLTLLTFGEWEAVLDVPSPDASLELASVMHRYARGTALAALGRLDDARALLGELRTESREAAREAGGEMANPVLSIAAHALAGEIALRAGQPAVAVERFRQAARLEDGMVYEEPPLWYYPMRHSLGRALLEAGDAAGAERVYREDLTRFPENGWSLFGLAQSLEDQGRTAEAAEVRDAFERAWRHSDVELTTSRF